MSHQYLDYVKALHLIHQQSNRIDTLERELRIMTENQTALANAVAALIPLVSQVIAKNADLTSQLAAANTKIADLGTEDASLPPITQSLTDAAAQLQAAVGG